MPASRKKNDRFSIDPTFILFIVFIVVLWIGGGASRADVAGQVVVRAFSWLTILLLLIFGTRPEIRDYKWVGALLLATVCLVLLQLVPLPPALWQAMPGREVLAFSASVSDQTQPWRPLTISPDATFNALSSLIVPVTTFGLLIASAKGGQWKIALVVLGAIIAGCFLGVLQFAGSNFDNPLINDGGAVSGNFANRNHMALFASFGCLLAPAWAYSSSENARWKAALAVSLVVFFLLLILGTGSRAGIVFGLLATMLGFLAVRSRMMRQVKKLPIHKWLPAAVAVGASMIGAIILSIYLGRAESVDRANVLEMGDDLRTQIYPTVVEMIGRYWPAGSGFGAFDPVYRITEPDAVLGREYVNHAHNDFLEIVLDGGILGLALLALAICWIGIRTFKVWRAPLRDGVLLARVASSLLWLMLAASLFDYPIRTPMMMALAVIAAVWLSEDRNGGARQRG
ncbi:MAG: hypothetical protein DI637_04245 [Citromicrobium sp.]|nr:MAG: hypothetical protein DI637_04245 [Citromicrobium sp.]